MMLALVTTSGGRLRIEADSAQRTSSSPLIVDLGGGRTIAFDRFDLRRPIAFELDPDRVDDADARWLVGLGLATLADASLAGMSVDIVEVSDDSAGLLSRLAVLEALRDAGELAAGSDGLVAAEQLVILTELGRRGLGVGEHARLLALAAVGPLLRHHDRSSGATQDLWARAVQATALALPDAHPARQLLEQRALLVEPAPGPWNASRRAIRTGHGRPTFRGRTGGAGRSGWVLWSDLGIHGEADAAPITTEHEGGAIIDVRLPVEGPSVANAPQLWVRVVSPGEGLVVAWAPLFVDGAELVGHLYLDRALPWGQHRLEVVSSPDVEVLTADRYRARVCEQLALGIVRASARGATEVAARLGGLLQGLDRDLDLAGLHLWAAPGARGGEPLLVDT